MDKLPRPRSGLFSSGPCAKRPGWNTAVLKQALLGRSHRSAGCLQRIQQAVQDTREILDIPADYRIGIVPGSDTGALEIALWNLLGATGVNVLCWESFSRDWMNDVVNHLKIPDTHVYEADYGLLPALDRVDCNNDTVFVWNGTTSGVRLANADWIDDQRNGLMICDATSAVFAMDIPWQKLDAITFSWQKALGGEAGFGMLVLSPRAVERLNNYLPGWPIPKLFRLRKGTVLNEGIFNGNTMNTISMLCVEDYVDALNWAKDCGGLQALIKRSNDNFAAIEQWVKRTDWIEFLAVEPETRSTTSVCLRVTADWFLQLDDTQQRACMSALTGLLEKEQIAFDINAYRAAPAGLRIWAGATVDTQDLIALFPWIEWACTQVRQDFS